MKIVYNPTCTINNNIFHDIEIARKAGYVGTEILINKLDDYLESGMTIESLKNKLEDFPVIGLGYVEDIERQGDSFRKVLFRTEQLCQIAKELNCKNVQLLTGPQAMGTANNPMYGDIKIPKQYEELLKKEWKEIRKITANNLKYICNIGEKYDVKFYLEALGWTPAGPLSRSVELIDELGCDNIGLVLDFWHLYVTGTTPDEVSKLDKKYINGVHFCDSLELEKGSKIDQSLRNVYPGMGSVPIKEYLDAIKSTGYDDWISGECFSLIHTHLDPEDVATTMKKYMEYTILY